VPLAQEIINNAVLRGGARPEKLFIFIYGIS
jgi:hypothetical protein